MDKVLDDINCFANDHSMKNMKIYYELDANQRKEIYQICEKNNWSHQTNMFRDKKIISIDKNNFNQSDELECLKLFIREYKYPIMLLDQAFIEYSLKRNDPYLQTWYKYQEIFKPLIVLLGQGNIINGLTIYKKIVNELKNQVINKIKENHGYKKFLSEGFSIGNQYGRSKRNIYNLSNSVPLSNVKQDQKYYISIDLISANYNCLRLYDVNAVLGSSNWDNLLLTTLKELNYDQLADFGPFIKSNKYLRQIIFGQLNCNKIMSYSRIIINKICDSLITQGVISEDQLVSVMHDEIIIKANIDGAQCILQICQSLSKQLPELSDIVRVQLYNLLNFDGYDFFIKEISYDYNLGAVKLVNFKCVDNKYLNQCISYYQGDSINQQDLRFDCDGRSASFESSLFCV